MIRKLVWFLIRKPVLRKRHLGFSAHINSYVDERSSLSQWNALAKHTRLYNSSLGRCTYIAGSVVTNTDVGAFCSIGPQCLIGGLGKHPTHLLSTHPAFYLANSPVGLSFADRDFSDGMARTKLGHDARVGARVASLDWATIVTVA